MGCTEWPPLTLHFLRVAPVALHHPCSYGWLSHYLQLGSGPPLARYTPAEMRAIATQSISFGHSPRSGIANSADSAGTKDPKAAPPEAPRMATARPYIRRETMVTRTPWKIA